MLKHYAESILGWSGLLFCAYAICALSWSVFKGKISPCEKKLNEFFEKIRQYRNKGKALMATEVILAVVGSCFVAGYAMRSGEAQAAVVDTYYDVYVASNPDGAYNYWMEAHDQFGKPLPKLFLHFCSDFEPEFSPGQTLTILNVEHKWGCVSVANTHPGYRILRSDNGKPQTK